MSISILEKNLCVGCGLCDNVCNFGAIDMTVDQEGFYRPEVNDNCVECGLCEKKCPSLKFQKEGNREIGYKTKKYYAAWAIENYRNEGGSGGIFPLLSSNFILNGGVVYGSSFSEGCKEVYVRRVANLEELPSLFKSKYVQSKVGNAFRLVREDLENNKKVLYVGTPCQVDALYSFLGKNYNNLYTIDILCHGVPSPFAYQKFLEEISDGNNVLNVDFRDKTYGWGKLIKVEFSNGKSVFHHWNQEYLRAFSNGLSVRESCFKCNYSQLNRVGDVTIGDFWGVKSLAEDLDDNKGTSIVAINTDKGSELVELIKNELKELREMPYEEVVKQQSRANAAISRPMPRPKMRDCFFKHLKRGDSFSRSVRYAEKQIMDVGILGWWNETPTSNYGSTLTDFALYRYLEEQGLSVAFVSPPDFDREDAGEFCKINEYRMTTKYKEEDMKENNKYFDSYVVASDVLWYYDAFIPTGFMFMLDFASDDKKKISYATSFGNYNGFFPENEILNARYYLHKFDAIGVREYEAVDICKDRFDVKATQVMDPVFLCDKKNWERLEDRAITKTTGDYIFAYLLDPNEEKIKYLKQLANHNGCKLCCMTDRQVNRLEKEKMLNECGIIENGSIDELIYHIKNAKYMVTDSFHGLCFSVIFNTPFSCLVNLQRGASRFKTLCDIAGIESRMIYSSEKMNINNGIPFTMDFNDVNRKVDEAIKRSKEWFDNALYSEKKDVRLDYQTILGKEIYDLSKRLDKLEGK